MSDKTVKFVETGEVRLPRAGEWFRGGSGYECEAQFDFTVQAFPILRMEVTEVPDGQEGSLDAQGK